MGATPIPLRPSSDGVSLYQQATAAISSAYQSRSPAEMQNAVGDFCGDMERAYRSFVAAHDDLGAGRAAVFLYGWSIDIGSARGWEQKALRHLKSAGPCVERGYLALGRVGCEISDPKELVERADLALSLAREHDDHDLELRAMADRGLGLVSQGKIDEGFALLDDVIVEVVSGAIDNVETRAMTLCALMAACERSDDRGRAEDWTAKVEADPRLRECPIINPHCAIVYGAVDGLRGDWESAEVRLTEAMNAIATTHYHYAKSAAQMADLRLQQGNYQEAAELLRGIEDSIDVAPVLARLRSAEGKLDEASSLLRSAARSLGSDLMRLGPVLALLIDVELRRGDLPGAQRAVRRLRAIDEACNSNGIRAMARLGSARIAIHRREHEAAIDDLETALVLLSRRDRPLLTGQVRLELARALAAAGESDSARVEGNAALGAFVKLGAAPDIAASEGFLGWLRGSRKSVPTRPTSGDAPHLEGELERLTRREEEVADLVGQRLSNKEIAAQLFLSVRTVESHMDRILGKLDFHNRTEVGIWVREREASLP
jgi:DNA-binding CsgD family transcriptional regulator/tetratricopeptide (TPR) repeat protein